MCNKLQLVQKSKLITFKTKNTSHWKPLFYRMFANSGGQRI